MLGPLAALTVQRLNDRLQLSNEPLALRGRQSSKHALVNPLRERFNGAEDAAPFVCQFDGIGARVFLGAAASSPLRCMRRTTSARVERSMPVRSTRSV
jgi:hypothetical protein